MSEPRELKTPHSTPITFIFFPLPSTIVWRWFQSSQNRVMKETYFPAESLTENSSTEEYISYQSKMALMSHIIFTMIWPCALYPQWACLLMFQRKVATLPSPNWWEGSLLFVICCVPSPFVATHSGYLPSPITFSMWSETYCKTFER